MTDHIDFAEFKARTYEHARKDNCRTASNQRSPKQRKRKCKFDNARSAHIEFTIETEAEGGMIDKNWKTPFWKSPFFNRRPHQRHRRRVTDQVSRLDSEKCLFQSLKG